jgi:hypothetical protein
MALTNERRGCRSRAALGDKACSSGAYSSFSHQGRLGVIAATEVAHFFAFSLSLINFKGIASL